MPHRRSTLMVLAALLPLLFITTARADVLNMPTGLTSLEMVTVGNPGNPADTRYATPGYGSVDYTYSIGKYEVTAGQYCEFLNAVATTSDPFGLYNSSMWSSSSGCKILQTFSIDGYTYTVAADYANRPVNYVSFGDALRFANWLSNGQPDSGVATLATTEDGSYYLDGAMTTADLRVVTRQPGATWVLPTEDEWYKAAYHKNDGVTGNYFEYPTSSDDVPSNAVLDPDGGNNANYYVNQLSIGGPYYRTNVGEFEDSASPYGTFDQGGNVLELSSLQSENPSSNFLVFRGGGYHYYNQEINAGYRATSSSFYENDYTGFRVASVPEPLGITLLLCGIASALIWWRSRS